MIRNSGYINVDQTITSDEAPGVRDLFDVYKNIGTYPRRKVILSDNISGTSFFENASINMSFQGEGFYDGEILYWSVDHITTNTTDFSTNSGTMNFIESLGTAGTFFNAILGSNTEGSETFRVSVYSDSGRTQLIYQTGDVTLLNGSVTITTSIDPAAGANEGTTVNWTITFNNLSPGYYNYSITGISAQDLTSGLLSSSFYYNGSTTGGVTTTLVNDATTEGTEYMTMAISQNGYELGYKTISIYDTSQTPTATVSLNSTINEGTVTTVTVYTTNYPSGTLNWVAANVYNFEPEDLTSSSGSVSISSGTGTFTITPVQDGYTEGTEQFVINVSLPDGTIIGSSSTITINDTSTGTPEPTPSGETIYNVWWPISEYVNYDGAGDTTSNYSVSEVQQDYSGTGRLYLAHKITGSTSFYNDVPIACIQVLSSGGAVVENWYFGINNVFQGWTTHASEYAAGSIGTGISLAVSTVAGYSYSTLLVGAYADRFSQATSTSSSSTGAADGIADPGTTPLTVGEKTMPQASGTYYIYRETSGGTYAYASFCRSPSRTWSSGEIIRIAYIIGNYNSINYYTASDTLFVAIY